MPNFLLRFEHSTIVVPAVLWVTCMIGGVDAAQAQELQWHDFETALAKADTSGRPVLVDVWAPWCGWCHKLKREVYPSDPVRPCLADRFVLTRLNRDDTETTHTYRGERFTSLRLAQTLHADGVPTIVLLAPGGDYLLHLSGFVEPEPLHAVLSYVASGAYRTVSFEAYRQQGDRRCARSASAGTSP